MVLDGPLRTLEAIRRGQEELIMRTRLASAFTLCILLFVSIARSAEPVPDNLVVLTFDDSVKSQATFVAPLLKELGFGATFFVTEGFNFLGDKKNYMTWEEIRTLHEMGFEIGNHTRYHKGISAQSESEFIADLEHIEQRCEENGIPKPVTFAYPGNDTSNPKAQEVLKRKGYIFARRGGAPDFPYEGGEGRAYRVAGTDADPPLLIPSAGDARPAWKIENFIKAANQATDGNIAVIQFHGVPDYDHPWVHCDPELFRAAMNYLKDNNFTVVALRDLQRYVDLDNTSSVTKE